ncbi:MAG: hypothetical protein WD229_13390 [Pirellulales bacterium]
MAEAAPNMKKLKRELTKAMKARADVPWDNVLYALVRSELEDRDDD